MKDIIAKIQISPEVSIKEALKKLDEVGLALLFVCNSSGFLLGSLTDGDIRRRVLKTGDLQEKIAKCFNRRPVFVVKDNYSIDDVKKLMLKKTIEVIPVIDNQKRICDIFFWKDIFEGKAVKYKKVNIPVVIMAGGKGERLSPFTKIFPKSLIPVGDKPIIEIIIGKFRRYGIKQFYLSLNYKGEMIRTYLESIKKDYKVEYIWEKGFLGTAGSIRLIAPSLKDDFIVSNSDIVVDLDSSDLLSFHRKNKNILTIVGSFQHHRMPYGVIHFEKDGRLKMIQEKPEFDITINTGVYVLSREAVEYIPRNKHFDMTDLIQCLLDKSLNVGVYPVSEKSYLDVGQWEEYKKAIERL